MILENSDQEVILITPDPYSEDITVDIVVGSQSVLSVNGQVGHVVIDSAQNVVYTTGNQTISGAKTFVTGIVAPNLVYNTGNQSVSGIKTFASRPTVNGTGVLLSGEAAQLDLSSTVRTTGDQTISGIKTFASRLTVNGTGVLLNGEAYPSNNPSGFLTGVNLSSYATISNLATTGSTLQSSVNTLTNNLATTGSTLSTNLATTGSTLTTQINNLSGVSVLTYGNQTIDGIKTFRNSVYINNLYVTGTETIVNTPQINIASNYLLLNLTGGAVDGGIFFVTGTNGTGINEYGPIIGFDHSDKFKFGIGRRSEDLSLLNDIAAVQDITNYSGFVNNKYATILNLGSTGQNLQNQINNLNNSGFITGITNHAASHSALGSDPVYPTALYDSGDNSIILEYDSTNGWVGIGSPSTFRSQLELGTAATSNSTEFYLSNNPSGYITGVDLSALYPRTNPSGFITGIDTSNFYTKNNPSGFITGIDLSNYITGSVVRPSETGNFITSNQTGAFYTNNNPSGFITGIDLSNYATTGQLNQVNVNLQNQINNLGVNNSIAFAIALG